MTASVLSARLSAPAALRASARRAASARAVAARASSGKDYMESLPGVSAPMGFFDPAGFCNSPAFTVSEAKRFREAEVTHGRVSMLAVLGWLVAEEYHPFFGGEIGGPAFRHFQARCARVRAAAAGCAGATLPEVAPQPTVLSWAPACGLPAPR